MASHLSASVERIASGSLRHKLAPTSPNMVSLALGEPDFNTPEPIVRAMNDALADGLTHYGDFDGDPELRAALAVAMSDRSGRMVDTASVVVTHGGTAAITATLTSLVDPGDRVLIPDPSYSLYADVLSMIGAEAVFVPPTPEFSVDLDALAAACHGARMIILCNPVNPTGVVLSADTLRAVGNLARDSDAYVLVDEAYIDLVDREAPCPTAWAIDSLTDAIVIRTFSKSFAMTGWRIGCAFAPAAIATKIRRMHKTINGALNPATQRAALRALEIADECIPPMIASYQRRLAYTLDRLANMPGLEALVPGGAFYVFLRVQVDLSSLALTAYLSEHGVAVRPGVEFGPHGEGWVRLCYAVAQDELALGLDRIESAIHALMAI